MQIDGGADVVRHNPQAIPQAWELLVLVPVDDPMLLARGAELRAGMFEDVSHRLACHSVRAQGLAPRVHNDPPPARLADDGGQHGRGAVLRPCRGEENGGKIVEDVCAGSHLRDPLIPGRDETSGSAAHTD